MMAMGEPIFRAPKGTQDILPPESARWVELIAAFAQRLGPGTSFER